MYSCDSFFNPPNTQDLGTESSWSAFNTLLFLTGLSIATYAFARYAEAQNRLNYESRFARIVAGAVLMIIRTLHTNSEPLDIPETGATLIALGAHQSSVEALALASKLSNNPPQFLSTELYNSIPFVGAFLRMFNTIMVPVPVKKPKPAEGKAAVTDEKPAMSPSLALADAALKKNGTVALFPQGKFIRAHEVSPPLYTGTARLAIWNNIPIHVVRVDGLWSLQNPFIPLFIRNAALYRVLATLIHPNNIRLTKCCVIDFHTKPENASLSEKEKIDRICAEMNAYFRDAHDLTPDQIKQIGTKISTDNTHHLIWANQVMRDGLEKQLAEVNAEGARLRAL